MRGDAVLAAAVWRNVFKANEEVDVRGLAQIVSYMRRTLKTLDALQDHDIATGRLKFSDPKAESKIVSIRSPMLELPFGRAPGAPVPPHNAPKKA